MRIGLARGNQLLVAPVHMQYVTGFSRTGFSKEPAMNGPSGFQEGCGKLCRARLAGKARLARKAQSEVQSSKFRKPSTQNPALRTADRFLYEQRHRFEMGDVHLLNPLDLIVLSTTSAQSKRMFLASSLYPNSVPLGPITMMRGKIAETFSVKSIQLKKETQVFSKNQGSVGKYPAFS